MAKPFAISIRNSLPKILVIILMLCLVFLNHCLELNLKSAFASNHHDHHQNIKFIFFYNISFSITEHVFLICQLVSALQWSNNQNIWRGYISMPPPDVLSNKMRPYTWILENKNPPKAPTSTTGPSMRYFILILTSSGVRNA